jgi:cellulose synthase/poly-beta-1,6-N-acetylglucosamine synthase-like glycosyltransferase
MKIIFWLSLFGIFYAYLGYPLVLYAISRMAGQSGTADMNESDYEPGVSIIIPVFNEEKVIEKKIENMLQLNYPENKFEVLIISDGSTDRTREIVEEKQSSVVKFFELRERSGKAAALNLGLKKAKNEIIVFSDASIILDHAALKNIVRNFRDEKIGCVSGEDHIPGGGGEGFYGKYELYLRNQESKVHSIVGASGSFYAQRSNLCEPFEEGMAPDFLSVLKTVKKGYRAVTDPEAFWTMTSLKETKDELSRKVRTLIM